MIDQYNKIKISHTRTKQLRSEIEVKEKIKIREGTPLFRFVEDLIRMSELVKDPAIKRIFLHPYEQAKAGEPEWHHAIRNKIQKVIKLSKGTGSCINTFQLAELNSQIKETIAKCNQNPTQNKNSKTNVIRSRDIWSLAANSTSEELEKVKHFLEEHYLKIGKPVS